MIGMAQYFQFFWPGMTPTETKFVAVGLTVLTVALLYRRIDSIAAITKGLWVTMIVTVWSGLLYVQRARSIYNA